MNNQKAPYEYASFSRRLLAFFFDNILLSIVLSPLLMWLLAQKHLSEAQMQEQLLKQGLLGVLSPMELVMLNGLSLMITAFFWTRFAATPVKRLLGLRVIDAKTGEKPTLMQSVLRYLGYFISNLPMGLGFLWILFDKDKQAWHDKIAGTVVIVESNNDGQARCEVQGSQAIERDDDSFVA